MTSPTEPGSTPLAPARRSRARDRDAPTTADYDEDDLARGQAAAVLGALGRMQLRLDLLARQQSEALERIEVLLQRLTDPGAHAPTDPGAAPGGSSPR